MVLPEIDYGVYRAEILLDAGPFGGEVTGQKAIVVRR